MTLSKISFQKLRLLYDLIAVLASSILAELFFIWTTGNKVKGSFLILVPGYLLLAILCGVYTRYRVASASFKFGLLTSLLAVDVIVGALSGVTPQVSTLFFVLASLSVIPPRVLLNLNYSRDRAFVRRATEGKSPILVVGGAGYIGTYVVEELLKRNRRVRVLDKLLYGNKSLDEFKNNPNFELIEGDCTDISKLAQAMSDVSGVVHLAGLVGDPACAVNPEFTRHTNVISTRMVKEVAKSLGVPRLIFASSCSVYGASDEVVDETSKLNPVSLYATTKIDSEQELLAAATDDFHVTILRFATVFGHSRRSRFDLVANLFSAQAMVDRRITVTGADQWRPFIHCHDIAKAVVLVLESDLRKVSGEIFNVGDDSLNMTIGDLAMTVQSVVSAKAGYTPEVEIKTVVQDRRNYKVSFEKIRRTLGYQSSISMKAGVSAMIDGFITGRYGDYKEPKYSNVEITKSAVKDFSDPLQLSRIYQPLAELVKT